MEMGNMLFFMESRQKPELAPKETVTDAEEDLYQTSANDACAYTFNTTTWD